MVAAFARFHAAPLSASRGKFELAAWMNAIRGSTPIARVAPLVGVSRFALRRWLRGDAEPRLSDLREEREIASLTLCLSDAQLAELKQRLQTLRTEILQTYTAEQDARRVVQLNLQLFPLSIRED